MDRSIPGHSLAGQAQHSPSSSHPVDRQTVLCDGHGIVRPEGDNRPSQPVEADGQVRPPVDQVGQVEPPVILAMTRKEAGLLINLLALEESDDARALGYRLCAKYGQGMGFSR